MGLLSAAMLAELQSFRPEVYPLLEIDFPSETVLLGPLVGISSSVNGYYEPRVKSFGSFRRSAMDQRCGLESSDMGVTIVDADGWFSRRLGRGEPIQNSACRVILSSPNVASTDWFTVFAGRLYSWENSGEREYTLTLNPRDLQLNEEVPRLLLNQSDWPRMDAGSVGMVAPILYGNWDSSGGSGLGAISCPYVDTTGFVYVVCFGYAVDVPRVWSGGTLMATSSYSIVRTPVNGRIWTRIDFTSTQGTNAVRCDATGYETVGDGTGAFISDPTDQLKHFLVNFVFNDTDGMWLADTAAPIDTTSFSSVKNYLAGRAGGVNYQGALKISSGRVRANEIIQDWCGSVQAQVYWKPNGDLAIAVDRHSRSTYVSSPQLRYPESYSTQPKWTYKAKDSTSRIVATVGNTDTGAQSEVIVADPLVPVVFTDSITMQSPAFAR